MATPCRHCGSTRTPSNYAPPGYCTVECWTQRHNRTPGRQQGDIPPDRPGNPNAEIVGDPEPHDGSEGARFAEFARMRAYAGLFEPEEAHDYPEEEQ